MARIIHSPLLHLSPPFPPPFRPLLSSLSLRRLRLSSATSPDLSPTPPPDVTAASPELEGPAASPELEEEGPVEISPFSTTPIFATDDNPTTIQVATSVLLTGSVTVFLFRALRRRFNRAKKTRVRSTGLTDPKQEALDRLRAVQSTGLDPGLGPAQPPSPIQAFLGSIAAGVLCAILYKFTTTIEAGLNRQSINSDSFSVRQITITIRTIVNGLCYLATFIFGINSAGLMLYSIQLALGSVFENDSDLNKKEGEKLTVSEKSTNDVGPAGSDLKSSDDNNNSSNSSQ